jgi:hypothetical protein
VGTATANRFGQRRRAKAIGLVRGGRFDADVATENPRPEQDPVVGRVARLAHVEDGVPVVKELALHRATPCHGSRAPSLRRGSAHGQGQCAASGTLRWTERSLVVAKRTPRVERVGSGKRSGDEEARKPLR